MVQKNEFKLRVAELFAGVGGFRLGLEGWNGRSSISSYKKRLDSIYQTVWSNQWEPATKLQHASDIYKLRFGENGHSNEDISKVNTEDIPDHDLLVGGFPCQDYSVAKQLSKAMGIEGKKGVLWWDIRRIIEEKGKNKPHYVMLENVDRLIKSPVSQRGRDFSIILASLSDLGYIVEWRVINAAEYGMPQRRRRIYLMAYHKDSLVSNNINEPEDWLKSEGVFAKEFKIEASSEVSSFKINGDLVEITKSFNIDDKSTSPFLNAGVLIDRQVWTVDSKPDYRGPSLLLRDIIQPIEQVPEEYFINGDLDKWKYLKGAKREARYKSDGSIFYYVEGPMSFPDPLDKPARTIITAEGGRTASRFKHVINQDGRLRRLTPIELERANMFPDNHTMEANDTKRAFFMGNALVVGVVEKLGNGLKDQILMSEKLKNIDKSKVALSS